MGWQEDPVIRKADKPAWENDPIITASQDKGIGERIGRQLGLTGRYLTEGLASTAGLVADPVAALLNKAGMNIQSLSDTAGQALSSAGVPEPQTGTEQMVAAPSRALAGTLGFGGAGRLAQVANAPQVAGFLGSNPALQAKSAIAGSTAGEALRQGGASEPVQIAGNIAGSMLFGRGQNTQAVNRNAVKDATLAQSRKAGYTIPPTQANPSLVNKALEGWAGKISTAQGAAIKNQPLINKAALKSLGIADDVPVTPELLDEVRRNAGQAYNAVAKLGTIPVDQGFKSSITSNARQNARLMSKFPQMANKEIQDLTKALNVKSIDGEDAVMLIRKLRNDASLNIAARDPAKDALGRYQKKAADAIEDMIGRHLGKTGNNELLNEFRNARTTIAKTYSIENALNQSTGNVTGAKLAAHLRKGKPLSGELLQAAKTAQSYPGATQEVLSSIPGFSPLDAAVGAIGATSMQSPQFLSYLLARPAARSLILSQPYQSMMLNPSYKQGLLDLNPERVIGATSALQSR